tara:strand:+ start:26 stop:1252 length:1227 start_codon:yes stop_codon:yes gene_type:complete
MATHDYILDNASGAAFRTDLNNALAAIVSNNSNSSSPATTYAYQWWADTSNAVLKIRNSANNAWIELLQLDGTLTLEDGSASTPALAFRDDLNTGIFSSAADKFNVATGGVERMELGSATIFNDSGADVDFRIEGDADANLFHLDASSDAIRIGGTPATNGIKFEVERSTSDDFVNASDAVMRLLNTNTSGNTTQSSLQFTSSTTSTAADSAIVSQAEDASGNSRLEFWTDTTNGMSEKASIDSTGDLTIKDGDLVIGTSGHGIDFSAASGSASGSASAILNDYEEGTWTPSFFNISAPTYSTQTGRYTKIGRMVYLTGTISVSSGLDTGDSSAIAIGNLPFTADATHSAAHFTFGATVTLLPQSHLEEFDNVNMTSTLIALLRGANNLAYSGCNTSGTLQFAFTYAT